MISLAERIMTLMPAVSLVGDHKRQFSTARLIASDMKGIPVIHIDEVANLYAMHEKEYWLFTDFPNWAPPFEKFFVEWQEPETWNMGGEIVTTSVKAQIGFVVFAETGAGNVSKFLSPADPGAQSFITQLPLAKWALYAHAWSSRPDKPLCGAPLFMDALHVVLVKADGGYINSFAIGEGAWETHRTAPKMLSTFLQILGFGLSFMHCKGVTTDKTPAPLGKSKHVAKNTAGLKHYTLRIGPAVRAIRGEAGEGVGIKRALHICRGHFMHYTEARPLFGKYAGTFYCPDHLRGNIEAGRVVKEYRVTPEGGKP